MTAFYFGRVIGKGMAKTAVVEVRRSQMHPKLHAPIMYKKKFKVHDENEVTQLGDFVKIRSCRPMSKTKFHTIEEIITKSRDAIPGSTVEY